MISLGEFQAQYHAACEGQPVIMTTKGLSTKAGTFILHLNHTVTATTHTKHTRTFTVQHLTFTKLTDKVDEKQETDTSALCI